MSARLVSPDTMTLLDKCSPLASDDNSASLLEAKGGHSRASTPRSGSTRDSASRPPTREKRKESGTTPTPTSTSSTILPGPVPHGQSLRSVVYYQNRFLVIDSTPSPLPTHPHRTTPSTSTTTATTSSLPLPPPPNSNIINSSSSSNHARASSTTTTTTPTTSSAVRHLARGGVERATTTTPRAAAAAGAGKAGQTETGGSKCQTTEALPSSFSSSSSSAACRHSRSLAAATTAAAAAASNPRMASAVTADGSGGDDCCDSSRLGDSRFISAGCGGDAAAASGRPPAHRYPTPLDMDSTSMAMDGRGIEIIVSDETGVSHRPGKPSRLSSKRALLKRIGTVLLDNRMKGRENCEHLLTEHPEEYRVLKKVLNIIFVTVGVALLVSVFVVIVYTSVGKF